MCHDDANGDGGEIFDGKEDELEIERIELMNTATRDFIDKIGTFHGPSYKENDEEGAGRHHEVCCNFVAKVEDVVAEKGQIGERSLWKGTEDAQEDDYAHNQPNRHLAW